MELFNEIIWNNSVKKSKLRASVAKISEDRKVVDLVFEDGRWFKGLSVSSFERNRSWIVTANIISAVEFLRWCYLSERLDSYEYVVGVDIAIRKRNGSISILPRYLNVNAENDEAAKTKVVEVLANSGVKGTVEDVISVQLAKVQLRFKSKT